MNMSVANSSVKKGETLVDTAMTLNAMRPDVLVVRHSSAGAVALLSQKVGCPVINAGDGAHEHPTQALLDALTIRRAKGKVGRLTWPSAAMCCIRAWRVPTFCCSTRWARGCGWWPLDAASIRDRRHGCRGVPAHGGRAQGRRRGDDAEIAARAHGRLLRTLGARVFPLLRSRRRQAQIGKGRCTGDASRDR
jgi:hypothetical protein